LKKKILPLLTGVLFLAACEKDNFEAPVVIPEPCEMQTANPAGRSYPSDSVVSYICTSKHCGIMPLSTKNYWIYEDSIFSDGVFLRVQFDTLRFTTNYKTADNVIWWQKNSVSIGLPETLYANDSAFFSLADRMFTAGIKDVKKDYSLFPGDSLRYLASFEDAAAMGRSLKLITAISTPAGSYSGCLYFEKNARNYRKDQVYFKPGIGVVKYIQEKAPMGDWTIKLQQISTLIKYHIE
jgi:hypothetical protein